ncbi:MAG: imidazoleglycerol-phosphate dehydratase HisB [Lachnospiraceae bacterium]|nr:imidazoleglycerol-phosphate dehydratase HisB [Lachnospiraceae bacterium]
MRIATIQRKTTETEITLTVNLDGTGKSEIITGVGFLNHMLTLFAAHGQMDLDVTCKGDTEVDDHHSVEDIGIVLGAAVKEALGDKKGINRYGFFLLPMDEALIEVAMDFSGREHLSYDLEIPTEKVGSFDTELVEEFFLGFVRSAGCTLHVHKRAGRNSHHIIEGAFKAFGRAMRQSVAMDERVKDIPSTKGIL